MTTHLALLFTTTVSRMFRLCMCSHTEGVAKTTHRFHAVATREESTVDGRHAASLWTPAHTGGKCGQRRPKVAA